MTADIAHELRTPLSLILGHAEAVHDGVLPPTRENFEIIREEAERLEHLVNDLRTLSLAVAGELTIIPQPIEPERLLNEVAALYQYHTRAKDIALQLDIASPLPLIEVDPGRITQVLTNILDNALRHTPADGQITLSAKQTDGEVELAIQDSGPGVPAEMLAVRQEVSLRILAPGGPWRWRLIILHSKRQTRIRIIPWRNFRFILPSPVLLDMRTTLRRISVKSVSRW